MEGFFYGLSGFGVFVVFSAIFYQKKVSLEDEDSYFIPCLFYCIYMAMFIPCFIFQIVFFYRIKKYNITEYNCSDAITNELIRKGTEDNAKQITRITINFYIDVFQASISCLAILIGLVLMGIDKLKNKSNEQKEGEKQSQDKDNGKSDINKNSEPSNPEIPLNTYYPEYS